MRVSCLGSTSRDARTIEMADSDDDFELGPATGRPQEAADEAMAKAPGARCNRHKWCHAQLFFLC